MLIQRDPQLFTIFNPKTPIILVFTSSRISETSTHLGPLTMEEENSKEMSKKEAKKYLVFLVKEWSSSVNEVSDYVWIVMNRRIG